MPTIYIITRTQPQPLKGASTTMTKTITIGGEQFTISAPYAEGQTISAAEARSLNQTRAENIGNNLRKLIKEAVEAGDRAKAEAAVAEADANYSFAMPGQSAPRIVDPVEKEAHKLAREFVAAKLSAIGLKLSGIHPDYASLPEEEAKAKSKERFDVAIGKAAADESILALAKKNVAAKKKATDAATVDLGL